MTRWFAAASLAALVTASGCGWILGLDEFVDAEPPTAAGGGGGGAGGGPVCEPEATEACYGGPAGTEDVGICKAGTRTCAGDGTGWSACEQETVPAAETCAATEDENCDGFDCGIWAKAFENSMGSGKAIATDASGNIFVTGSFEGTIDLGATPLIGVAGYDIFLASFDASGNHRWSAQFSDATNQTANGVAVDGSGNVIIVGLNDGTVNFGGGGEGPGLFVAKFTNEGDYVWSRTFPGSFSTGLLNRPSIAVDITGDVIIGGTFTGTIELDDGPLTSAAANTTDIFVAKLRATDGTSAAANGGWARRFGTTGSEGCTAVGLDPAGSVLVTGQHADGTTFGNLQPLSGTGMFLVKLDTNGIAAWRLGFAGATPRTLAVGMLGNPIVAGSYSGTVDFGGGPMQSNGMTLFAAQFDYGGEHIWSRSFDGTASLYVSNIETNAAGLVGMTGSFNGQVDFGAGPISAVGDSQDVYVTKLDSQGSTQWSRAFGDGNVQAGNDLAIDEAGNVVLTGIMYGSADFGTGPLSVLQNAIFVAKLGL